MVKKITTLFSRKPVFISGLSPALLACFILFNGLIFSATSLAATEDENKIQQLQQDINKLKTWMAQARKEQGDIRQKLRQSDLEISKLASNINNTKQKIQQEQDRLKKLRKEQSQLHVEKAKQKQQLAQQIVASQRLGQQGAIKVLLNQDNPQTISRMMHYYRYFNQARITNIETIAGNLKRLDNIESEIQQQQQRLDQQQQKFIGEKKQLGKKQQQQQTLITKLDSRIRSANSDIKDKQQDQKQLQNLVEEVTTLLQDSKLSYDARPIRSLKGKLPKPLGGRLLRAYGNHNPDTRGPWQGWLIKAAAGSRVTAIHHGRVVFSDWLRGYGLVTLIDHGKGYLSLYARNQSLFKTVGEWVYQGETIAMVGKSGGYKQPALYFEIRHKGRPLDPAAWLRR